MISPRDQVSWVVALVFAFLCGSFPLLLLAACAPTQANAATYTYSGTSVDAFGTTATVEATITGTGPSTVEVSGTPSVSVVGTPAVSVVGSMPAVSVNVTDFGLDPSDVQWAFMLAVYFGGVCIGRFLY